jgi:hypothetical protein
MDNENDLSLIAALKRDAKLLRNEKAKLQSDCKAMAYAIVDINATTVCKCFDYNFEHNLYYGKCMHKNIYELAKRYTEEEKNISCSQCGQGFGPGDHGFSHCKDHKGIPVKGDCHGA